MGLGPSTPGNLGFRPTSTSPSQKMGFTCTWPTTRLLVLSSILDKGVRMDIMWPSTPWTMPPWVADDELAGPVAHLTEQHRREVVQLWLVHAHSGELVPDTLEAHEPSCPKKAKLHSEELHFMFENVTYFGPKFRIGLGQRESIFSFGAEKKLEELRHPQPGCRLCSQGGTGSFPHPQVPDGRSWTKAQHRQDGLSHELQRSWQGFEGSFARRRS